MAQPLKIKRDRLIAELTAKLTLAEEYDDEQLRAHRSTYAQIGKARRDWLRELSKLPLADLAEMDRHDLWDACPKGAVCPVSQAKRYRDALEQIGRDYRTVFTVQPGEFRDVYGALLAWLPEPEKATVC